MAMEESEDDLSLLLTLDPAKVAILASRDNQRLEKLQAFANNLSYYTNLVQRQQAVVSSSAAVAATEEEKEEERVLPAATASSATAPVAEPTEPPEPRAAAAAVPVLATPTIAAQANQDQSAVAVRAKQEEEDINENNVEDSASIATEVQNYDAANVSVKKENILGSEEDSQQPSSATATIKEEEKEGKRAKKETKRPEIVDLTLDDESDDPPTRQTDSNKRRREEVASVSREIGENSERKPRKLARDHSGGLSTSDLRRSEGRTRTSLNSAVRKLGLKAKFSQGAISTCGGIVSHITLNSDWNHLPKDEEESFEWWLGEGPKRLQLVSGLDPSTVKQSKRGIPIFWAEKQAAGQKGGMHCYYVGHYRCVQFLNAGETKMKGIPRQALLEFQFVRFDDSLAARIAEIPAF